MTTWEPHTVRQIFGPLVPDKVTASYERLLEADGVPEQDATAFFGDESMAGTLVSLGMAMVYKLPGARPLLEPVDPELALQGVLGSMQAQALHLQQLLIDGTRRAIEAHGMRARSKARGLDLAEVVTDREEIGRLSGSLIHDARHDFMEIDALRRDIPDAVNWHIDGPRSVTHRAIYDQASVQDPVARKALSAGAAAGQQIRWRPHVFTKIQLCDTSTALVALTLTGMGGALRVRSQPLVAALREYFELLWDAATPLAGSVPATGSGQLTPEQHQVLSLLAAGLSQDRIAEHMGKGLTTIRRRQSEIFQALGVTTLFQAGAEAQRRGLFTTAHGGDPE